MMSSHSTSRGRRTSTSTLPIEQRAPGGLGLHLIRRLVDSIEYEYSEEARQSRITFRKTRRDAPPRAGEGWGGACWRLIWVPTGVVVIAGRLDAAQAAAAQAFLDKRGRRRHARLQPASNTSRAPGSACC